MRKRERESYLETETSSSHGAMIIEEVSVSISKLIGRWHRKKATTKNAQTQTLNITSCNVHDDSLYHDLEIKYSFIFSALLLCDKDYITVN